MYRFDLGNFEKMGLAGAVVILLELTSSMKRAIKGESLISDFKAKVSSTFQKALLTRAHKSALKLQHFLRKLP